mgnify:CR=1 FL=1
MAIKAGLVGVNPKGVDHNGMPIASDGNSVKETQLTANGKKFFFAYDETSEKYGYKLDGAGDFIPFESAGGGPGWVKPASLSTEGLGYTECTYVEGGYYVDGDICIVDIIVQGSTSSSRFITGLPRGVNGDDLLLLKYANSVEASRAYTGNLTSESAKNASQTQTDYIPVGAGSASYAHYWGMYPITQ